MKTFLKPQPLTRAEKRAAALDGWVKRHIAASREADLAKKSRLKELRLAREALQKEPAASSGPGAQSDSGQTKKSDES